jgi:ankyrin repeat protein
MLTALFIYFVITIIVDVLGDTPLHLAVKANKSTCVRLLLQSAANPLLQDREGNKPLDTAVKKGYTSLGVLLLEYENTLVNPPEGTVPIAVITREKEPIAIYKDGGGGGGKDVVKTTAAVRAEEVKDAKKTKTKTKTKTKVLAAGGGDGEDESSSDDDDEEEKEEEDDCKEEGEELKGSPPHETFVVQGETYQSFWSEADGLMWYYHPTSGESVWDDPRDFVAVNSVPSSPTSKARGMFTEVIGASDDDNDDDDDDHDNDNEGAAVSDANKEEDRKASQPKVVSFVVDDFN